MPAANVTVTAEFEFISNVTLTPATTYIDFDNDTAETDRRSSAELIAGQLKQSGTSLAKYGNATGAVFSVDASAYAGRIRTATLKYQAVSKDTSGTPLRYSSYANFVDISSTLVNATNINSLGGDVTTAASDGVWTNGSGSGYREMTYDITSLMRSKNGQLLMVIWANNAHENYIKDISIELVVEPETIKAATATIHRVFANEDGDITVGGNKYTEFGTSTVVNGLYQGDTYTVANTYEDTVDDSSQTARYEYVSGVGTVNLEKDSETGTNDIYVIYNKIDYAVTPITVTVPAAVSEQTEITIHVAGTPTSEGAAAVDQDVVVTIANGETSGTNNTLKLLPGSYKYSFEETTAYVGIAAGNDTILTPGTDPEIKLTANTKTAAAITVKYYLQSDDTKAAVGTDTITAESAVAYVGDEYTLDSSYLNVFSGSKDANNTFKRYTPVEGTYKITPTAADAATNVLEVPVTASTKDYYYFNDFNGTDAASSFATVATWGGIDNTRSYAEHVTASNNGQVTYADGKMVYTPNSGGSNRNIHDVMFGAVQAPYTTYTAGDYSVAFDWTVTCNTSTDYDTNTNRAHRNQNHFIELLNSEGNVLLGLNYHLDNSTVGVIESSANGYTKYYTGGSSAIKVANASWTAGDNIEIASSDNNKDTKYATNFPTATATDIDTKMGDTVTYHIEISVNQTTGKALIKVSKPNGTSLLNTEVDTDKNASFDGLHIHDFKRSGKNAATHYIDNFEICKVSAE